MGGSSGGELKVVWEGGEGLKIFWAYSTVKKRGEGGREVERERERRRERKIEAKDGKKKEVESA